MASLLRVGGITPLTTIDYPGELAAVVYCQGCPWRCRYCHNAHLLDSDDGVVDWCAVQTFLEHRRGLLDGVVFSGGEPTAQRGLGEAIDLVRGLGYKVGLHTAGCYPERLAAWLPALDWVGLDIKAAPEDYAALTGVAGSGERAWRSLRLLRDAGVSYEVRITVHDALLPPPRLDALIARLHDADVGPLMLQRCRSDNMLDAALGDNAGGWGGAARWQVGCAPPDVTRRADA